jgi:hypothetical protein
MIELKWYLLYTSTFVSSSYPHFVFGSPSWNITHLKVDNTDFATWKSLLTIKISNVTSNTCEDTRRSGTQVHSVLDLEV